MFKKISILTLTLAISLDATDAFSKPKSKRAGSNKKRVAAVAKLKKAEVPVVQETTPVVEEETVTEAAPEPVPAPVEPVPTNITTTNNYNTYNTNDLDAIKAAVREELNANGNLLARTAENEGNKNKEAIKKATNDLSVKLDETRSECSDIKSNLDTIFGLSTATTVSSGLGTLAAGGALGVGIAKSVTDKKLEAGKYLEEEEDVDNSKTIPEMVNKTYAEYKRLDNELAGEIDADKREQIKDNMLYHARNIDAIYHEFNKQNTTHSYNDATKTVYYETLADQVSALQNVEDPDNKIAKKHKQMSKQQAEKTTKVLGNVRTGLLAGATLTSAVSTGTSIGATVTAAKLAEKMSACNAKLAELRIANNALKAELEDAEAPAIVSTVDNVLSACTGYDENNIKTLKTTMTASAVVSGIGTAAAGTGTVTSFMANSNKVKEQSATGDGNAIKKEKTLNLVSNIAAGVATGTSLSSTVLSATAMSRAKKDSDMAGNCENALAQ